MKSELYYRRLGVFIIALSALVSITIAGTCCTVIYKSYSKIFAEYSADVAEVQR